MRIALCDDCPAELREIEDFLKRYHRFQENPNTEILCFSNGERLLQEAGNSVFDLCLLDILMPGLSGIETARRLRRLQPTLPLVFLTNTPDFAVDAFQVRAANYLLKPVEGACLYETLDELLGASRRGPVEITAAGGSTVLIAPDRIVYLECVDHRIIYHLSDKSRISGRTIRVPFLEAAAALVKSGKFLQPHRSYLVNAGHILRLDPQSVTLDDGTELAVSQLRRKEFRGQFMRFLEGGQT